MVVQEEPGLILVVDDNEMNRDMLARRLRRQKYQVVVAADGLQALELLELQSFDLVLLDMLMPNMSGVDVLQRIKAHPDWHNLPVIIVSAVDDLESVVQCIELGAEDYLFKPFNPVLLNARISATLEKKRLRNQDVSQRLLDLSSIAQQQLNAALDSRIGPLNVDQKDRLAQVKNKLDEIVKLLSGLS